MKKSLIVALALVIATTFIGCNKDDDNSGTPTIIGKWKAVKFSYYTNGQLDNTETVGQDNSTCPDYIEFKSDNTYVVIENDANCDFTIDDIGAYNYNGTTLTYNSGASSDIVTVTSLTNSDLRTDLTETSSDGTVYKNVAYYKRVK